MDDTEDKAEGPHVTQALTLGWDEVCDVPVLTLTGEFVYPDSSPVMQAVCRLLREAPRGAAVVDVSRLRAPASWALLMLFPAAVRHCGGWPAVSLHLAAPADDLAEALRGQSIPRYLPVHATVAEALFSAELEGSTRRGEVTLPAVPESLRLARRAVTDMWSAGPSGRLEDALIVVNELAENVVDHVGQSFTIAVACTRERGLVAVSDSDPDEPTVAAPGDWIERGLGMRVVQALSQAWGVRLRLPRGKTVWAALDALDGD